MKTLHRLIDDLRPTQSRVGPQIASLFIFLGAGFVFAQLCSGAPFQFETTGSLVAGRYRHTATLLPNGKVLVAGGVNNADVVRPAEVYDPALGTWTPTGRLADGRVDHTATLLPNGKVLVAGGQSGDDLASAELYDPTSGTWTSTGSLATARLRHTATLLPNGKVSLRAVLPAADPSRARNSTIRAPGPGHLPAVSLPPAMLTRRRCSPTAKCSLQEERAT